MPEPRRNCEYVLVHYAPSAVRETRIAVGLFLFEASGRLVGQRLTEDWRAVRCLDPQADLEMLGNLPAHFERLAAETVSPEETFYGRLRGMEQEFSGALQVSSPRGVQTTDPEQELERLFEEYVAPRSIQRPKRPLRSGSRPWVRAQVAEALRRHGLWNRFERDVSVEQFTAPGDAFRLDFGCRPNGVMQYLHALSLERDWTQAKLLGYTFWRIRENTAARLTAIVADADPAFPAVQSCRRILAEAQIALEPLSRLDSFLETVRQEFGPN